jgi:putative SOS response-associated peptidase YedK
MRQFHDRMPVIVPESEWDLWLDREVTDPGAVADLLAPAPDRFLVAVPVSPRVNNDIRTSMATAARNDHAAARVAAHLRRMR